MKPGAFTAIARVVLQNDSALAISTGMSRGVFDSELMTDWNQIPTLPGTAIAGALRAIAGKHNSIDVNETFGFQNGDLGSASRLSVSFGLLQGEQGQVREKLILRDEINRDSIWNAARDLVDNPQYRHGVRLNHRGAVDNDGKYEIALLHPGHRFTAELRLSSDKREEAKLKLNQLVELLGSHGLSLGRRKRSGMGRLSVVSARMICVGKSGLTKLNPRLSQSVAWTEIPLKPRPQESGYLILANIDGGYLRVGGGRQSLLGSGADTADQTPYSEIFLTWIGDRFLKSERRLVIPGSALRGPLRHRTLFYLRCLDSSFVDTTQTSDTGNGTNEEGTEPAQRAIDRLFGSAKQKQKIESAGRLRFFDTYLAPTEFKTQQYSRTSIDRFTGGVRQGLLFTEENAFITKPLRLYIHVDPGALDDTRLRQAFELALRDLTNGLLPIGGGATNGLGSLVGKFQQLKESNHAA